MRRAERRRRRGGAPASIKLSRHPSSARRGNALCNIMRLTIEKLVYGGSGFARTMLCATSCVSQSRNWYTEDPVSRVPIRVSFSFRGARRETSSKWRSSRRRKTTLLHGLSKFSSPRLTAKSRTAPIMQRPDVATGNTFDTTGRSSTRKPSSVKPCVALDTLSGKAQLKG